MFGECPVSGKPTFFKLFGADCSLSSFRGDYLFWITCCMSRVRTGYLFRIAWCLSSFQGDYLFWIVCCCWLLIVPFPGGLPFSNSLLLVVVCPVFGEATFFELIAAACCLFSFREGYLFRIRYCWMLFVQFSGKLPFLNCLLLYAVCPVFGEVTFFELVAGAYCLFCSRNGFLLELIAAARCLSRFREGCLF